MDAALLLCLAILGTEPDAAARGIAQNENFLVSAPTQESAEQILATANFFRHEISRDWLGKKQSPLIPKSAIDVTFSERDNWAGLQFPNQRERVGFRIALATRKTFRELPSLRHEIVHLVLHTEFGDRLPAWDDEGAACTEDSAELKATLRGTIDWYPFTRKWPSLARLLDRERIDATDYQEYAVAWSLSQFLLERGGKGKMLKFAVDGKATDWNSALRKHYDIADLTVLQEQWQSWATRSSRQKNNTTAFVSD